MLISVIQTSKSDMSTLPELIDKHFQQGDLKSGGVLIQGLGKVNIKLKTAKIRSTKQTFRGSWGTFLYEAGKKHPYKLYDTVQE